MTSSGPAGANRYSVRDPITEGGYELDDPAVARDLASSGPPRTAFGLIVEALRRRRERGTGPLTVMSCDNLPGNGGVARRAVTAFARERDAALADWIEQEIRFPGSMVDRITPQTTDADREMVRERFGIEDGWPVVCEPFAQWVLEDDFAAGRPPYEDAGVQVVGDVEPYELMKLRLLNASHQALAYFGRLCGYEMVHDAAQDPVFQRFLLGYMDEEGRPIDVSDRRWARLAPLAARQRSQPEALLGVSDVFGDLVDDERFTASYLAALESLHQKGARATVEELVARS